MVTWIFGNTKSGKTTLAKEIVRASYGEDLIMEEIVSNPYKNAIWLDGDNMRGVWTDLGLSKKDRWEQNLRVARLARMLSE